jgi:hypothetical protein
MRLSHFDSLSASQLYHDLELEIAPELRGITWSKRKDTPFSMGDILPHSIRTAVEGKGIDFFTSGKATAFLEPRGWSITRMRHYSKLSRGEPKPYLEVRIERHGGEDARTVEQTLYHVTPLENVSDITAHGLQPRHSTRPDMHSYSPRIHLARTHEAAERIERLFKKYDAKHGIERFYTILAIDAAAVREPKVDQEFRREGIYTMHPIPASAIKYL